MCEVVYFECCHGNDIAYEIEEAILFPSIESEHESTLNEQFHTRNPCDVDGIEVISYTSVPSTSHVSLSIKSVQFLGSLFITGITDQLVLELFVF